MEHQTRVFEWRTKKENLPSPFLAAQRTSVFEPKTLSWTTNPSISFFVWVISHRDDEWTRAHSLTFLSLFLSLSSCVQTRLLHSRLRDVHMKCTRHKGIRKQKREKENKKMCSRTPQKEGNRSESSPKTEIDERTSVYERTTRASSRISTPQWRCCTFAHRSLGLIKARTRSFWRWTVSRFVWVPWWNRVSCVCSVMPSGPPLSRFLALVRGRGIVFLVVFSLAGERTRRSLVFLIFFFWISSKQKFNKKRSFFVCFCPLFLLTLHLSLKALFLSLFLFERTKKAQLWSALTLFIEYYFLIICEHTHNASYIYSSLFIVFITSSRKRINR